MSSVAVVDGASAIESMDALELRAHLAEATEAALALADVIVPQSEGPFVDLIARDRAAEYRDARLLMRRLKLALTVKATE